MSPLSPDNRPDVAANAAKQRLSATDMNALARIAHNFVEANARRSPSSAHPTLNEWHTYESLVRNIESLRRNRANAI